MTPARPETAAWLLTSKAVAKPTPETMNSQATCGCCAGVEKLTPVAEANRPGLPALAYRAGTHATFFETMKARLSTLAIPVPTGKFDAQGHAETTPVFPLKALTTRDPGDPAIALLDSWATVADVLTFYQERLANEGFLRTATERRSILELGRLVGYALRPGVAATVYLAYTVDADRSVTPPLPLRATIPAGSRAQSIPGPGETPQSFETAEELNARTEWNTLQPRLSQPQTKDSILQDPDAPIVFLQGTSTNLKTNDPILIDFGDGRPIPYRVVSVMADSTANRTQVTLRPWNAPAPGAAAIVELTSNFLGPKREEFGVTPTAEMTRRVVSRLAALQQKALTQAPAKVAAFIASDTLPEIASEHDLAQASHFTKQEPWLAALKSALEQALQTLVAGDAGGADFSQNAKTAAAFAAPLGEAAEALETKQASSFLSGLKLAPSVPTRDVTALNQSLRTAFSAGADVFPRLLTALQPAYADLLVPALQNASVIPAAGIKFYALRVSASLFGHNASPRLVFDRGTGAIKEVEQPVLQTVWQEFGELTDPEKKSGFPAIALDSNYDQITMGPESWIIIDRPGFVFKDPDQAAVRFDPAVTIHSVTGLRASTMAAFGLALKVSQLSLGQAWFSDVTDESQRPEEIQAALSSTPLLRGTSVYAQSDLLPLAEAPRTDPVCQQDPIELDGLYDGLKAGRWVIVSGERADVLDANGEVVAGLRQSELAMLLSATQSVQRTKVGSNGTSEEIPLAGDKTHTFLQLSEPLAYCYRRETLTIFGNVVKATHGETRQEVLGSGDASQALQTLPLRQSPLTYLAAATPAGAASTLTLRVNQVEWHETDSLVGSQPNDRVFISQTDDSARTTVTFGNGVQGARPPTGAENIAAVYRTGLGVPGNVRAGQISLLTARPLNVTAVLNPLSASGGADREDRDQARANVPVALQALDRLVSIQDYADFSRTFAGIGKALSARLSDGSRLVVYVTIAGANDIPIDESSDLYVNLLNALQRYGDPYLPVQVKLYERLALVISASVRVLPDFAWEFVEPVIRATLLDTFSFQRRSLGQSVTQSEVITAIQQVQGVAYVDLDFFFAVPSTSIEAELLKTTVTPQGDAGSGTADPPQFFLDLIPKGAADGLVDRVVAEAARPNPDPHHGPPILPAQLITLSPDAPEALILKEVKS